MADIAKSDLFFVITTVAVVVLSAIIATLLIYLFIIIRDVKQVVHKVKEESTEMLDDIKDLRVKLRDESGVASRFGAFFLFIKKAFFSKRGRSRKSKEE